MIPKSIKWRLQLWYGLILVVVLAGLGITALQLEHWRQMFWLSTNLELRFAEVVGALHSHPTEGPREHRPDEPPPDRPPPDQFPDDRPPEQNPRPPHEFHLPPEFSTLFDGSDPNNFYFFIQRDGEELARSANVPPNPNVIIDTKRGFERINNLAPQFPGGPAESPRPSIIVSLKNDPSGEFVSEIIWVGCSDQPELQELKSTAWKLAVALVL